MNFILLRRTLSAVGPLPMSNDVCFFAAIRECTSSRRRLILDVPSRARISG